MAAGRDRLRYQGAQIDLQAGDRYFWAGIKIGSSLNHYNEVTIVGGATSRGDVAGKSYIAISELD